MNSRGKDEEEEEEEEEEEVGHSLFYSCPLQSHKRMD